MKFLSLLNTLLSAAGFCMALYGFWENFKAQHDAGMVFDWLRFEAPNSEELIIVGIIGFVIGLVCSVWFSKAAKKGDK